MRRVAGMAIVRIPAPPADWRIGWEHTHYVPPIGVYIAIDTDTLQRLVGKLEGARGSSIISLCVGVRDWAEWAIDMAREISGGKVQIDRVGWGDGVGDRSGVREGGG